MQTKTVTNRLIDDSLINSDEFCEYIEYTRPRHDSYLDTIVTYCSKNNADPATIKKLINPQILSKMSSECERVNLISRTSTAAPLF
jgi:Phage late-transcription coactivator